VLHLSDLPTQRLINDTLLRGSGGVELLTMPDKNAALRKASMLGHVEVAHLLLERGADARSSDPSDGETALMFAARYGNIDIANLLLKYGAETNAIDVYEKTALMISARYGNLQFAELLCAHGANPRLVDVYGKTAAQYAMYYQSTQRGVPQVNIDDRTFDEWVTRNHMKPGEKYVLIP